MGRAAGGPRTTTTTTAPAASRRHTSAPAAKPRAGSPLVAGRAVSRQAIAGRHGMQTGVWFHVTRREHAEALRTQGIRMSGDVNVAHQARWVDPAAVYVWPTEAAAADWVGYLKDGGYGGRLTDEFELLAVNARHDEVTTCPDNEDFGGFLGAWAGERHSGEPWPTSEESDSAAFYQSLLNVAGPDGATLRAWLDEHGDDIYWEADDDEDDEDVTDERFVASRMVRAFPDGLRDALCSHYAANGRALMLLSAVPPGRVVDLTD